MQERFLRMRQNVQECGQAFSACGEFVKPSTISPTIINSSLAFLLTLTYLTRIALQETKQDSRWCLIRWRLCFFIMLQLSAQKHDKSCNVLDWQLFFLHSGSDSHDTLFLWSCLTVWVSHLNKWLLSQKGGEVFFSCRTFLHKLTL